MQANREYRDRDGTEVAVLDALVDRSEEGMTVFELRAVVEVDIDELETALAELKEAGLITVENDDEPMRIYPDERAVPDPGSEEPDGALSLLDGLRKRSGSDRGRRVGTRNGRTALAVGVSRVRFIAPAVPPTMTVLAELHESHGATFTERGGRRVVDHYGRPERVHRAVRSVVGTIEMGYGIVEVTGDDRVEFVDNAVTNRVPDADGRGVYALLLDPQGGIETELYVYNAGEKLLCFVPPGTASELADEWAEKTFIQDVTVRAASDDFGVFGVHGPKATEKIASVLTGPGSPDDPLTFVRGTIGDWGVTIVRTDDLTGEEGYEVICGADDAARVFDALINHGLNAAPFGHRTLEYLYLEAGTPLFETELEGTVPTSSASGTLSTSRRGVTSARRSSRRSRIRGDRRADSWGFDPTNSRKAVRPSSTATDTSAT